MLGGVRGRREVRSVRHVRRTATTRALPAPLRHPRPCATRAPAPPALPRPPRHPRPRAPAPPAPGGPRSCAGAGPVLSGGGARPFFVHPVRTDRRDQYGRHAQSRRCRAATCPGCAFVRLWAPIDRLRRAGTVGGCSRWGGAGVRRAYGKGWGGVCLRVTWGASCMVATRSRQPGFFP